jgi:hypothetical protein
VLRPSFRSRAGPARAPLLRAVRARLDAAHTSAVYFIDPAGRERFVAEPIADRTSSGASYLPAGQLAAWGQGIAQVARTLAR